ncbi:hypothetical protein [Paenirhodobacter populi]|nr:hypothetical protein [Sinirhodobacter populi]
MISLEMNTMVIVAVSLIEPQKAEKNAPLAQWTAREISINPAPISRPIR